MRTIDDVMHEAAEQLKKEGARNMPRRVWSMPRPRRRVSGLGVALAAAVAVFALIGLPGLFSGDSDAVDVGASGNSTLIEPEEPAVTTVLPEGVPFTVGAFTEIPVPEGTSASRDFVEDAAAVGFGTVVVGYHLEIGPLTPLAWVAFGPSDWHKIDLTVTDEPGMSSFFQEVVPTANGGAAILGVSYEDDSEEPDFSRVLLTSENGLDWELTETVTNADLVELGFLQAVAPQSQDYGIRDVVRFGSLLVAAGSYHENAPALFVSDDNGATWTPVADDSFDIADEGISGLAANGYGVIAVGEKRLPEDANGHNDFSPVFWWSTDGVEWKTVTDSTLSEDTNSRPRGVEPFGTGFVAFGNTGINETRRTVLWTSPDGVTWERSVLEELSNRIIHHMSVGADTVRFFAAPLTEPDSDQFGAFEVWEAKMTETR